MLVASANNIHNILCLNTIEVSGRNDEGQKADQPFGLDPQKATGSAYGTMPAAWAGIKTRLTVFKVGLTFFDEGFHAFFLVFGSKEGMEISPLEE